MSTHGRSIEWRNGYGLSRVDTSGHETREEAFAYVLPAAIQLGWTPPQWWQFWRWSEAYWKWDKEEREVARLAVRRTAEPQ
jgi:hypothetical protein